jgi:outer membrane protein TolC
MKSNKKLAFLLFILTLVVAACSGQDTDSEPDLAGTAPAAAPAESMTETATEPALEPAQETAANGPSLEPTPTEAQAVTEIEPETAVSEPTAAPAEQVPTAEVQINGRYESTYFRGSETAPITMIDYSDFL